MKKHRKGQLVNNEDSKSLVNLRNFNLADNVEL